MATSRFALVLSSLPALALLGAGTASALEYQCTRGAMNRSVAVQYQEPGQRVPCEVIYNKPPRAPETLWNARTEVGFCESKADELAQTLERSGWSCDRVQGVQGAAAEPERDPSGEAAEGPGSPPEAPETTRREEQTGPENGTPPQVTARPDAATPREAPAEPQQAPAEPQQAPSGSADPVLQAALDRDLQRLKASSEADVQADSAGYGDLNGDGRRDAAVLITFDSGGADYVQYLVAYLFHDGTYQPVASRLIGGRHRQVHGGELAGIRGGAIVVDLRILTAEDAACCPSGSRTAAFALQDGELVSVE